jgi:hypothetical protein
MDNYKRISNVEGLDSVLIRNPSLSDEVFFKILKLEAVSLPNNKH